MKPSSQRIVFVCLAAPFLGVAPVLSGCANSDDTSSSQTPGSDAGPGAIDSAVDGPRATPDSSVAASGDGAVGSSDAGHKDSSFADAPVDAAPDQGVPVPEAGSPFVCPAGGSCLYVSPSGSDSNRGTSAAPFQTIQHAADVVNPGDIVIVEDGVYTNGNSDIVYLGRGGTSGAWVTFVSENAWGAKLDGQNVNRNSAFKVDASYIRVQNFEVYGVASGNPGGATAFDMENPGGFVDIVGNNIHDSGKICTDSAYGQDGIFTTTHDDTIEGNVIHDIGRFATGENGCTNGNSYYQNHDHGIYVDAGYNHLIQNNVFYNNARGWSIQLYPSALDSVVIVNNTFAFPNPYEDGQIIVATTMTNSFIGNNLFYSPTNAAIYVYSAGADSLTVVNNLSTGALASNSGMPTGLNISSNLTSVPTSPLMADPSNHNFQLVSGSPAIGAGTSTHAPATDLNGTPRANPPSIGAYE